MSMGQSYDGRINADGFYFEFDGTVFSTSAKGLDFDHEGKSSDATTLADTYEVTVPGKKVLKLSGDFVVFTKATNGAAQFNKLKPHYAGNALWGREGNGTGKPKGGAPLRVSKASPKYKAGETVIMSVEFEMNGGDLLFDEATAVW
jgi:hypothetical protein